MKRKVREDRLNLRRPGVRPERWVLRDGCITFFFFKNTEVGIGICCGMFLPYVTISPFVMVGQSLCCTTVCSAFMLQSYPLFIFICRSLL